MKAIVYTNYGSPYVLQLKEVGKPVPGDYEVLINVEMGVCEERGQCAMKYLSGT